jgi:ketosteroid isomerase-like protein
MDNKKLLAGLLVAALLFAGWLADRYMFKMTEVEKIEQVIFEAAQAFQEKEFDRVGEFLSDEFIALRDRDKQSIVKDLKRYFFQVHNLKVSIEIIKHENEELEEKAKKAGAVVVAKVTGTIRKQKFQAMGGKGADTLLLNFTKKDGTWKVAKARLIDTNNPIEALKQLNED